MGLRRSQPRPQRPSRQPIRIAFRSLAHLHSAHDYIRLYDGSPDVLRASLARIQSAATILTRLGIDSRLTAEERAA